MNKVLFILLVVVSIISFHCQKEVSYVNVAGNQNGFLPAITLQGNVLDENGQPAVGVAIKVREKTTITDARGYFRVSNASAIEKNVLVTAEKPGYFKAYRSFIPTNGVSQVMIKLTRKDLSGQINSSIGGDVTLSNGSKITLPANGVVTASGGSYAGPINVYAAYIDPTSKDISAIINPCIKSICRNDEINSSDNNSKKTSPKKNSQSPSLTVVEAFEDVDAITKSFTILKI